jgi:hypothetical protein
MSNMISDVRTVIVDGTMTATFTQPVASIQINVPPPTAASIILTVPDGPEVIQIATPGVQGPPGVKNVYVQEADPAVQYGWGPEDANKIWIPIT